METEASHGKKKLKGCGLLRLFCGRSSLSKESISHSKQSLSSSPAKLTLTSSPAKLTLTSSPAKLTLTSSPAKLTLTSSPANAPTPNTSHPQRRSHANTSQLVVRIPASAQAKRQQVPLPGNGLSGELDSMIFENQKANGSNNLVRASSGNVMLYGQLGNIWGTKTTAPVMCRALSRRMDPEKLKEMGNEEFKAGRPGEALALYNRAITLDPNKASYRSNKAAALAGMGRLIEAVVECKEATRIDSLYSRAHHRLANLYLRLGEAEKAVHHYKLSLKENDIDDISKAMNLQMHIVRCSEARNLKEWQNMLKECQSAISGGADSAPKVFASQAEALLRLGRHEEADSVLKSAPKFEMDAIRSLFGADVNGYILMIQAEVELASGRFDEAVKAAEMAAQDQKNREINEVVRKVRAVASARNKGNELFKSSDYREACIAYGEGLDHDPLNAILLCNRAACLSKLQQWDKAIEECNTVLNLRPSYAKARLRRADCFAKLGKWEASVRDYQMLMREFPGDREVSRALSEARSHLQRK